ncbi:metal-dependent hydrolase [Pontibacillus chungwhensis BH030062]|uniref:Metal-dependent hydrolase n=1 Tax=Pontibacillus chungwhensis BH030062 TaxID=1385513 RepID=A0A0A2UXP5_9BACI|nr:amidohydrolase [Pontibacillus chungwhensis]KGP93057.1 metal-dependent hydrolase [Pontibacillus chungwhensis BH030062]
MIIENVRIYSPDRLYDPDKTYSLYIEDGVFTKVQEGSSGEIGAVDGEGRTIAAGFIDSHMHLLRYGLLKKELDLTEVSSWKDMKQEVEQHYTSIEDKNWIFGKGFDDAQFTDIDHLLTSEDLNEIDVDKYMYFMHHDQHECVISYKLLKKLEKEEDFYKQPEVFKERDQEGNLTGRFKDTMVHFINYHLWERSIEDTKKALCEAIPYLLQNGVTSVHTDDRSFVGSYDTLWKAYEQVEAKGDLHIEAFLHHYVYDEKDLDDFIQDTTLRTGEGTNQVKVGSIKIFLDGTQRLHTAAMRQPYPDAPETTGQLIYQQEELNRMIRKASEAGMQVAVHALGDRAVESALIAFEQEEANTQQLRHRIIHAQTLGEDLLVRLKEVGAYIETQPTFLMGEWDKKDKWSPEELLPYCDAFKTMLSHQIPITLSSDAPIGSINPIDSVFAAVNRVDDNHNPKGGWMPQEKLTIDESFKAFSETPAHLEFQEQRKGLIKEGYQADFVFLNQFPSEVDPIQLRTLTVEETWTKGACVYTRKDN